MPFLGADRSRQRNPFIEQKFPDFVDSEEILASEFQMRKAPFPAKFLQRLPTNYPRVLWPNVKPHLAFVSPIFG
jgi:hypothetical protein